LKTGAPDEPGAVSLGVVEPLVEDIDDGVGADADRLWLTSRVLDDVNPSPTRAFPGAAIISR
jgi:hypothetical protein